MPFTDANVFYKAGCTAYQTDTAKRAAFRQLAFEVLNGQHQGYGLSTGGDAATAQSQGTRAEISSHAHSTFIARRRADRRFHMDADFYNAQGTSLGNHHFTVPRESSTAYRNAYQTANGTAPAQSTLTGIITHPLTTLTGHGQGGGGGNGEDPQTVSSMSSSSNDRPNVNLPGGGGGENAATASNQSSSSGDHRPKVNLPRP